MPAPRMLLWFRPHPTVTIRERAGPDPWIRVLPVDRGVAGTVHTKAAEAVAFASMRLLFLTYSIGGQSNYLRARSLAACLAEAGHRVTVVGAARRPGPAIESRHSVGPGELRELSVASRAGTRARNSGLSVLEVARRFFALAGEPFDLVHGFGHRPTASQVGSALARTRRVPFVADWSDLFGGDGGARQRTLAGRATLGAFDRWLEPRVYRRADAVTAISEGLRERAQRLRPERPVILVRPGPMPLAQDDPPSTVRARLGIPAGAPVLVHVSQNHQDLELLRRALVRIASSRRDVHLLVVGPEYPGLEEAAEQHGLRDRLHCTGVVPHRRIAALLQAADVALLPYPPSPTNSCRFPCSFAEYAAAGVPVVTQPTGDLADLAGGCAALFVDPDAEAMADGVDRLLREPGLSTEIVGAAQRLSREELSWSVGARRLVKLYDRLLSPESAAAQVADA